VRGDLERAFPRLAGSSYEVTSPADPSYNCIAWAAGDVLRWWWPASQSYWPRGLALRSTVDAFVKVFRQQGYESCVDASLENGWEKIALYAKEGGSPTHAARQLPDGTWTSKLGKDVDISHDNLDVLCGNQYGNLVVIMRRCREPIEHGRGGSQHEPTSPSPVD
jgi:hypothetical protein